VIAYLIMLHDRPEQALRLLRAIYSPEHTYVVHVDRRAAEAVTRSIDAALDGLPNASRIASGRSTYYGWRMVDTQLRGMERALEAPGWEFFVNLSGQDYPLFSQEEIAAELSPHRGQSLLDMTDQRVDWPGSLPRIERFYVELLGRPVPVPGIRRRFPPGVRPVAGGQWMILSREACEYLVGQAPDVERLRRFYRHTGVPDEGFIHTALANSPLRSKLVSWSRRYVEFSDDRPRTLTADDVERLRAEGTLFARKFDADTEPAALDRADALMARR
jgi:hypothetical protein